MSKRSLYKGMGLLVALVLCGCGSLKYDVLKNTSVPNPPGEPIKVYVKQFPVQSKASVVDPLVAVGGGQTGGGQVTNTMASVGNELVTISRSSRIEDLSGALLRELRQKKVRVFTQLDQIADLETVRLVDNPFVLVPSGSEEAQLEISGAALINSQRVNKIFSQETKNVEIELTIKDLKTGNENGKEPLRAGIIMTFNSRELEEAMAIAVVTSLTQKVLF